ncbi:MAG: hypothetical protein A2234_05885 [Elusimicrobia bacterium RIFOXYA2_FULL_58_8]|nr:MAG: hypothetical protein A2285_05925 [Elusimicrobia bacterium RIFOXYA12_FULL_57_11]OGS12808.1 MAG: hypothetical protein A2234_05885 [Elusimicrobia bacterium RIFOXYA2_FULL_58_8]
MEALGRLSCKVAHDFNNILGAIEGYATLAMNGLKKDDLLAQDLQEIRSSVAKAAVLGRQLIAFGGRQMLHKAPCEVNGIIGKALERAERLPAGNFNIETRLEPALPGITGDALQLEQALANLLLNAREAMPKGGTAVISSCVERLEGAAVKAPDQAAAGTVFIKISIQDSGAGMSAETFERLFEPLFSTKQKGQGAGLGLSFVYGVVRQHNGWVEARTEPGQGSEFTIFLPTVNS